MTRRGAGSEPAATGSAARAAREGTSRGLASPSLARLRRALSDADLVALGESLDAEVQERTDDLRALVTSLTLTEQKEARRISEVLHDDLQQVLCGIQMHVLLLREGTTEDAKLQHWASQAHEWISEAIRMTRQLAVDFSPPVLHDEGVFGALDWLAGHMEQTHGLHVEIESARPADVPLGTLSQVVYQVVRELLINVARHAGTDRALVSLELEDETLVLRVRDHGRGFEPDMGGHRRAGRRLGLRGARERIGLFGGSLDVHSKPGDGTEVALRVPLGGEWE